jgi:hypothetical protein
MSYRAMPSPDLTSYYLQQAEELVQRRVGEWGSCLCSSPTAILRRVSPVLHLGSTVKLTLMAKAQVRWLRGCGVGELSQPLTGCGTLKRGPTSPLGNTVELALVLWVEVSGSRAMSRVAGLAPCWL